MCLLTLGFYHPKVFECTSPLILDTSMHFHRFMLFFLPPENGAPPRYPMNITFSLLWVGTKNCKRSYMLVQRADFFAVGEGPEPSTGVFVCVCVCPCV